MLVIIRRSEEKLLAKLEQIKPHAVAWRAVYFYAGADGGEAHAEVRLQLVVNMLKKVLEEPEEGRLFFHEDGDIVLLCKGEDAEALENAKRQFHALFPDDETVQTNAAMIYDLSVQFNALQTLAERKSLEAHEREVMRQQAGKVEEKPRAVTVDMAYAKDVLARRQQRKGIHVQLAEDDMFTLTLVENILSGHTVLKSMDGVEALETYYLNAPDVVFLDINMPHMNGHEVLEKILKFDPDAFVVMLSGNSYMADVSKAVKTGARGFVTKPFPKEKLLNYLKIYRTEVGK